MTGRTCVVTGANTGIGRVTAAELARAGARVVLACRSEEKTRPVIDAIRTETGNNEVEFLALDLANLAAVRRSAAELIERGYPIDVLINNAGLAGQRGLTADGLELTFGVNHVGHFLFTTLLLDTLKASAPARIVNVSSRAHERARRIDWDAVLQPTASIIGLREYGQSKLANVLFTRELARRLEGTGVTAYALHPGVIASDIWRRIPWPVRPLMMAFMVTTEEGARTTLYCATARELADVSGRYYADCEEKPPNPLALDTALSAELWDRTEALCERLSPA
ncbi:MAG: SDR family oxidoreductase [Deltaproteobacteria bacterium]|nr:SDR family oxidoreductase [Deltaproteobacteria bacterium]